MRVHELAAELGWTSRQLIAELCRRGEYVKSTASALGAPVVRDIRRDFAVNGPWAGQECALRASRKKEKSTNPGKKRRGSKRWEQACASPNRRGFIESSLND
jgi:hypothetical protein